MGHLIDKDALVAEIEKRIEYNTLSYQKDKRPQFAKLGKIMEDEAILSFINTLEVKEVDLDKEIQDHIRECLDVKFPTTDVELIKKDVAYTAKKFFELGFKAQKGE